MDAFEEYYTTDFYRRQLVLNVILLKDPEINKSLFDYLQCIGEFELLGEMTRLTMKLERENEQAHT
jgi:hypothetical protein